MLLARPPTTLVRPSQRQDETIPRRQTCSDFRISRESLLVSQGALGLRRRRGLVELVRERKHWELLHHALQHLELRCLRLDERVLVGEPPLELLDALV